MSEQTTIETKNDYIINSHEESECEPGKLSMLTDSDEFSQEYLQECLGEIYQSPDINTSEDLSIAVKMICMGCSHRTSANCTLKQITGSACRIMR